MYLTEEQQKWSNIISESLGIKDSNKLGWMSQYAQIHELYESVQTNTSAISGGIYSTPLNTIGFGNPYAPATAPIPSAGIPASPDGTYPAVPGFHSPYYSKGSGDIPQSTLSMSLEIAAMTIGLELVPVIPSTGPWAMLSYMDFPYAGGKLGRVNETSLDGKGPDNENKPIYVKINIEYNDDEKDAIVSLGKAAKFLVSTSAGTLVGSFIGFSRVNGDLIVKVDGVTSETYTAVPSSYSFSDSLSIADIFRGKEVDSVSYYDVTDDSASLVTLSEDQPTYYAVDLVGSSYEHVQGFQNFFNGSDDPMSRGENETGVGNTIGVRTFTKLVQMGAYEVTGTVTRQQLQDLPVYGVDVISMLKEAIQNRVSQAINNRILNRVFSLGVTNAINQKKIQGVDLNLYIGSATSDSTLALSSFPTAAYSQYVGVNGETPSSSWVVNNAVQNTSAENVTTHQRRLMTRMLAAANLIATVSRWGRGTWAVANTQIISALQDASGYVVAPMTNTLVQDGSRSLYFAGSLAGLNLYVDPNMEWNDTRVCVGRKSTGKDPGVIFMPYILADTVQIVAEGTMAPKILTNSRYALVDAGFYPEQSYYTFMVATDGDGSFLI